MIDCEDGHGRVLYKIIQTRLFYGVRRLGLQQRSRWVYGPHRDVLTVREVVDQSEKPGTH